MEFDSIETESTTTSSLTSLSSTALANRLGDASIGSEQTPLHVGPPHLFGDEETTLKWGRKTYLRGKGLRAKKRKRIGWQYAYGEEIEDGDDDKKAAMWLCHPCYKKRQVTTYMVTSSKHSQDHLKYHHRIDKNGSMPQRRHALTDSLTDDPAEQPSQPDISSYFSVLDYERLKQKLIEWIVVMHIAFSQVENEWFRDFLGVFNKKLVDWIPKSGDTVRKWIVADFDARKNDIRQQLCKSKSSIHLSFDLWTSPNLLAIVGVVAHYINERYEVETLLLGLRRLRGRHSGENIAEAVVSVVNSYKIADKIGCFVLDNATSNDTCVEEILRQLNIDDSVEHRRLRCLGHIINLGAKAFLFGQNPDAFVKEVIAADDIDDELKALKIWRAKGPIGKLHNVVVYIRRTPQRREEFDKYAGEKLKELESVLERMQAELDLYEEEKKDPLMVTQDNSTRWNSTYLMIERALKLRDTIDLFIKRAVEKPKKDAPLSRDDELSSDDWLVIARTCELLKPFYTTTIRLQSRAVNASHGALWETLPTIEFLLGFLESKAVEYGVNLETFKQRTSAEILATMDITLPSHENLLVAIKNGWDKLEEYYRKMDDSPFYTASVVLNPVHKWRYFTKRWIEHPDWLTAAKAKVQILWLTFYKATIKPLSSPVILRSSRTSDPDDFEQYMVPPDYNDDLELENEAEDEYDIYLRSRVIGIEQNDTIDLCRWWGRQEGLSPSLARMAFDLLSIPAMSAECERVFSSTKILITDRRARMKEDIIEASECLRAWYKSKRFG
jgi:hypothetical protein